MGLANIFVGKNDLRGLRGRNNEASELATIHVEKPGALFHKFYFLLVQIFQTHFHTETPSARSKHGEKTRMQTP